jgi:hypothetical protein
MSEKRERGSKRDQRASTPPVRDPGEGKQDRHRIGETADAGGIRGGEQPSAPARDAQRKKAPEETEIERAQEDETNMGHPDRPYA